MTYLRLVRERRAGYNSRQMRTHVGSAALFCVIAAIFLVELTTGAVRNDARLLRLGALPDSGEIGHEYWRLITFGFSHWDLNHLLLNTVLLLILGPIVERRAGAAWLLLVFLTASIASGAGILFKHQLWPSQGVSLGASGGLFGLLGAALVLAFRVPSHTKFARMGVIIVLAVGLTYSFFPGVSMIGHIIGLLVGIAMGFLVPQATARPVVADA
ncbi:MAG: rhomboid family intramembrane serine protease [Candidatus Udaeobacter sp.]